MIFLKFELDNEKIKKIISKTKNSSVNVEETIMNTISSDFMLRDAYVEIETGGAFGQIKHYMEEEGLKYEFLSNEYFDFIEKCIESDEYGDIYIALAYANEENVGCGEKLEYHIEGIDEDLIWSTGISTWRDEKTLIFNYDDPVIFGSINEDYGILIKKVNGKNVAIFGNRDVHGCYGPYAPIYFKSIEDQLDEPLYQILIEMMHDAIIFEE